MPLPGGPEPAPRAPAPAVGKKCREYGTRGSQVITDLSTNRACGCLTSQIGRDMVFSPKYGRTRCCAAGVRPVAASARAKMNAERQRTTPCRCPEAQSPHRAHQRRPWGKSVGSTALGVPKSSLTSVLTEPVGA
ncbi:hypothetical protein NQL31_003695 [Lotmaria passim]